MSLLTRKGRSLWGLIVFAFPQESSCISFANMVFGNSSVYLAFAITMVVWSGGPLTPGSAITRPTENICGKSTYLKTPQSGFLEEAEAVPAESNGPQRKTHALVQKPPNDKRCIS